LRGRVTIPTDERSNVLAAPGSAGNLLVLAGGTLRQLLPDGRVDRDFGAGGAVALAGPAGLRLLISDLALDHEGRIVVFGTGENPFLPAEMNPPRGVPTAVHESHAVVLRLTPGGGLDPSFGNGGYVVTDLGLAPPGSNRPWTRGGHGLVDSKDRPVFVGGDYSWHCESASSCLRPTPQDAVIARLTPDGELDPSFGEGDGVAPIDVSGTVAALAETPGRAVLVSASRTQDVPPGPPVEEGVVIRMDGDGRPDATLGPAGAEVVPCASP
jgi:uncharacterized delta-60 repeat protein